MKITKKIWYPLAVIVLVTSIIIVGYFKFFYGKISVNNDLIKELHNYFIDVDLNNNNCNGLFNYNSNNITNENLDNKIKLCLSYQKSNMTILEEKNLEKSSDNEDICIFENHMIFKVNEQTSSCNVKIFESKEINKTYRKMFGEDIKDNNSFMIDNNNICYLSGDKYYCGLSENYTYMYQDNSEIYRVLDKAIENGDEIYVYDYYVEIYNDICYTGYDKNISNSMCTNNISKEINNNFVKKYGIKYKHTFKKNNDGTYYWVSSKISN